MKTTAINFVFLIMMLFPYSGLAQIHKISGTIVAFDKFPLKNVEIKAKKSKATAHTDQDGRFNLLVEKKDVLVVNEPIFIEYKNKIVESDTAVHINLFIRNDDVSMRNVVSQGYISSDDLDYGMKHLARNNNVFYQFRDVWEAIHFALPEVNIIEEGGKKGVQFRGNKSVVGSDLALIVVDGVIVQDPSYLTPANIFRITKLSSSGAALYGSRAANGVVKIETIQ